MKDGIVSDTRRLLSDVRETVRAARAEKGLRRPRPPSSWRTPPTTTGRSPAAADSPSAASRTPGRAMEEIRVRKGGPDEGLSSLDAVSQHDSEIEWEEPLPPVIGREATHTPRASWAEARESRGQCHVRSAGLLIPFRQRLKTSTGPR